LRAAIEPRGACGLINAGVASGRSHAAIARVLGTPNDRLIAALRRHHGVLEGS
jgi:hypothetical protein